MENKVTWEGILSKIKAECYIVLPDGRTTLCQLTLQNGYTINGTSACVDASNFDMDIGRKIAFEDAIRQVWPLEGYLLAERLFWERAVPVATNPPKKPTKVRRTAPWGLKKDGTPKQRPGRKTS